GSPGMPFQALDHLARLEVPELHQVARTEQGTAAIGSDRDASPALMGDPDDPPELPPRLQVPDADRRVPTARQETAAAREDGQIHHTASMAHLPDLLSRLHVPDADRVIGPSRHHPPPLPPEAIAAHPFLPSPNP